MDSDTVEVAHKHQIQCTNAADCKTTVHVVIKYHKIAVERNLSPNLSLILYIMLRFLFIEM